MSLELLWGLALSVLVPEPFREIVVGAVASAALSLILWPPDAGRQPGLPPALLPTRWEGAVSSVGEAVQASASVEGVPFVPPPPAAARNMQSITELDEGGILQPGLRDDSPDPDHPAFEVAGADGDDDELRVRLGCLAEDLAAAGAFCRPRVVQRSTRHLDVYLDRPSFSAPAGWTVDGDGAIWTHRLAAEPQRWTDTCAAPLLIPLGRPDDDGQLYLDLEAAGVVALVGDRDQARDLARSVVTSVALSPLTDTVRIVAVGVTLDVASLNFDQVTVVDTWEEAEGDLLAWADQSHRALVDNAWPSAFVARGADADHDALTPLLVVAAAPPSSRVQELLAAWRPAALAVVITDTVDQAGCVIDCQSNRLTLVDLGLSCAPLPFGSTSPPRIRPDRTIASLDDCSGLATVSAEPRSTPNHEVREDADPISPVSSSVASEEMPDDQADPEYEILVRLLGEIRVEGGLPLRSKATAVIAYIALHRSVPVAMLQDACWADPLNGAPRKRLKDVLSECRAAIGSQHLPASSDGCYTTGPSVMTDTELFDRRVAHGEALPPLERALSYRSALELVTGKVFTYPGRAAPSFGWIDTENLLSQWEIRIEAVALQCADDFLANHAPERAVEVAHHALHALPLNTALTETLMRAHADAGDTRAIETVYRAHVDALARIHDTHPEESTRRLREDLRIGP